MTATEPIGIFDSGVGGLSVLRHVRAILPGESILYLADQAHVPYGPRSAEQIQRFCDGISRFLLDKGTKLIVVACNRASAAALDYLRLTFPQVPFVGMEPAVKPGVANTRSGKIGILATLGTFGSQRYAGLIARYAQGMPAFEDPCIGLVEQIEAGRLESPETQHILKIAMEPMLAAGVDTLVLGCTHYPFVLPLIKRLAPPPVAIIDPAPAVARQVKRVLQRNKLATPGTAQGSTRLVSTGDAESLKRVAQQLLGQSFPSASAAWNASDTLI